MRGDDFFFELVDLRGVTLPAHTVDVWEWDDGSRSVVIKLNSWQLQDKGGLLVQYAAAGPDGGQSFPLTNIIGQVLPEENFAHKDGEAYDGEYLVIGTLAGEWEEPIWESEVKVDYVSLWAPPR